MVTQVCCKLYPGATPWTWTSTYVQLSTSHQPGVDIIGQIPTETFAAGIDMPEARIKFHPNGGEASHRVFSGIEAVINPLDKCSNLTNVFSEDNLWDIISLFARTGYSGSNWILKHPIDTSKQLDIVQNAANSSEYFSTILSKSENATYIITYPQTHYYLYANWTPINYTITYYRNHSSSDTATVGTTSITYGAAHEGILRAAPTAPSNKVFLGWDTNRSASTPKFDAQGVFWLESCDNVNLYAIWGNTPNNSRVQYKASGGFGGPRLLSHDQPLFGFTLPGKQIVPTNASGFNSLYSTTDGIPRRPGYLFAYWVNKNGTRTVPGGTGNWANSNDYEFSPEWWAPDKDTQIIASDKTTFKVQTENKKYKGFQNVFKFMPAVYDRIVTITPTRQPTSSWVGKYSAAYQVIDEYGTRLSNSFGRYELHPDYNTIIVASSNILLKANKTYYFELSMDLWEEGEFTLTINLTPATNTEIISPNGGKFKIGSNSSFSTGDATVTFRSNRDWVGIASKVEDGLPSFNGDPVDSSQKGFPGKPQDNSRSGYWFEHWIGTTDFIPVYSKTISSDTAWAAHEPKKDFSISAIWNPNRCFIKYHGNGATAQHTPNSEHQYNITSKVSNNSYEKFVNITYDSRGGSYETAYWNSPQDNVVFIDKDDDEVRKVRLNHTFDTWNTNNSGTGANTEPDSDFTFTNTTYGYQHNLYAIWTINSTVLPKVSRPGFEFMGWYTDPDGGAYIGGLDSKPTCDYSATDTLNLYAHWNPLGLVEIYTNTGWRHAIPYVYAYNNVLKTYEWQRALTYIHNGSAWVLGTDTGQNMTNEQLEDL